MGSLYLFLVTAKADACVLTDASNVFSGSLDLDLSSVDSNIPSVVPPVDGPSTSGVDFLGSLSQMGDNLLRSPPGSSSLSGSTERQNTAPESTTLTDGQPEERLPDPAPRRPSTQSPSSPQAVEPSSSTGDADTQTTPPSGGNPATAAGDASDSGSASAAKTSTTTTTTNDGGSADVDSIEFACNLTFDTTDLIDAGARHEVIDVITSTCHLCLLVAWKSQREPARRTASPALTKPLASASTIGAIWRT